MNRIDSHMNCTPATVQRKHPGSNQKMELVIFQAAPARSEK